MTTGQPANWVIVTAFVPALLVSSALILWQLLRSAAAAASAAQIRRHGPPVPE